MMQHIEENALIARIATMLPRSLSQVNTLQESDAEILRLPGLDNLMLAVTTDAIVEEIESGLYANPYLLGWMTVMANLSDLAAVGAEPLGLLIAQTLPHGISGADLASIQTGIRDACLQAGTCVLGGDTNFSDRLHTTGTGIGILSDGRPLMRTPCEPDQLVFCTGLLGMGNAFAALRILGHNACESFPYRPSARLREGRSLRSCATACMDTSDGLIPTLDQLGRLNRCGFLLTKPPEELIAPAALQVAHATGITPWMLLAAPHGEFELVFTVHRNRLTDLQYSAQQAGWTPLQIGIVTREKGITLQNRGTLSEADLASIRNYPLNTADERLGFPRFLAGFEARWGNPTKQ
jgi:thiamine-monophosphate kinase